MTFDLSTVDALLQKNAVFRINGITLRSSSHLTIILHLTKDNAALQTADPTAEGLSCVQSIKPKASAELTVYTQPSAPVPDRSSTWQENHNLHSSYNKSQPRPVDMR